MRTMLKIAIISLLATSAPVFGSPSRPDDYRRGEANTPEARLALERYGKCVARLEPREASRLLTMDFTKAGYQTGLRQLATETQQKCAYDSVGRGKMRSSNLLFSGAMAEALLEAHATPINARLAVSAAGRMTSYSPTDAVAQCLARLLPDQVAAMFATAPASEAEGAATSPLVEAVPTCAKASGISAKVDLSVPALRAMVATAAYRLISRSDGAGGTRESAK